MSITSAWDVEEQCVNLGYGATVMTKKNKKSSQKVVIDSNVCKMCGTKVFIMMTKTKFKCVLCRNVKTERN